MDEEDVTSLIQTRADESINLEYKAAFKWKNQHDSIGWLQARVIKAVLGFTNTERGGLILIGVNDDGRGNREYVGVPSAMLSSFRNTEALQECLDRYADGPLSYTLKLITYEVGDEEQVYVAITVNEFKNNPVLCTRDLVLVKDNGNKTYVLRKYDMYARSRKGRFGTVKVTGLELQEVVNLAHTKAEQRIIELFSSVMGGALPTTQSSSSPYEALDDDL